MVYEELSCFPDIQTAGFERDFSPELPRAAPRSFVREQRNGRYDMNIPRLSPIDDDVQVLNEDEYEAKYQARQEGAPSLISGTRSWRAGWTDPGLDDRHPTSRIQ